MIAAHPVSTASTKGSIIVLLCPFCDTQVTNNPQNPKKRFRCRRCQSPFPAVPPEFVVSCSHCGDRLLVPRWIVGSFTRCPGCGHILKWTDEAGKRAA